MAQRVGPEYPGAPVTVAQALAAGIELRAPRWGLWDAVIAIVASMALALGVAAVGILTSAPLVVTVLLGITLPWIGLMGWPVIATRWRGNGPRIDLGFAMTWSDVRWGVGVGAIGLTLAAAMAWITLSLVGDFTSAAGEIAAQLSGESEFGLWVFALAVMVGAPIVEETAFRGLLFAALRKRGIGAWATIVITGVAFALFHFEPVRFLILLPIGVLYGWLRMRTGSLGAPIVAHMVNNAPAAVALLIGMPQVTP